MSDSDHQGANPSAPLPQPSLDALALADALAQMRAAGKTPRLSQLLAVLRLPLDATGPLADAVMAEMAEIDDADLADADADETPVQLSPGTLRGLAAIFGTDDAPGVTGRRSIEETPALVAETPAVYEADQHQTGQGAHRPPSGLLELARGQRLDAETLAERVMLSPAALMWLDHVALPLERQPEALVAHLVGALGVDHARVSATLAEGEPLMGIDAQASIVDLLWRYGELTPAQRAYWGALLSSLSS